MRLTHASRQHDPTMSLSCQLGGECPEWDDFPTAAPTTSSMLLLEIDDYDEEKEDTPLLINLQTMTAISAAAGSTRKDQARILSSFFPSNSNTKPEMSKSLLAQRFPVKKKGYRRRQKQEQQQQSREINKPLPRQQQESTSITRKPRQNKKLQEEQHPTNRASSLDEQQTTTTTKPSMPATIATRKKRQITHTSQKKLVRRKKKQQLATASTLFVDNAHGLAAPPLRNEVASRPHQPNIADSTALGHNISKNQDANDTRLSKRLNKSRRRQKQHANTSSSSSFSLNDDQQRRDTSSTFPESEFVVARPPPGRVVSTQDTEGRAPKEHHWTLWKQQKAQEQAYVTAQSANPRTATSIVTRKRKRVSATHEL